MKPQQRLHIFWSYVTFLQYFSAERSFLKWKFFRKRITRGAVDATAKRIVSTVSMTTHVVFEGRSKRDGIKRHALTPVKGLTRMLQYRAMVVLIDEFVANKLCSQCHRTLSCVKHPVLLQSKKQRKRRTRKGAAKVVAKMAIAEDTLQKIKDTTECFTATTQSAVSSTETAM